MNNSKTITAVLCQVNSILYKKQENIKRFDEQLQFYSDSQKIDIVIFPQMSFTGYDFKNCDDALPLAVKFGEGAEFQYCSGLAKRLKSYVLFGYIEKREDKGKVLLYNSAAIIDRDGKAIFNTRKTHLYFADELWATEGEGFKSIDIITCQGQKVKCAVGICMDINEKHFTSKLNEFGDFVKEKNCEVILFPTNWVDHDEADEESSMSIYNYWLNRLKPLLKPRSNKNILFLAADRIGQEYSHYDKKKISFLGSSCGMSINPNTILGSLDKKSEKSLKISYELNA